MSTESSGGATPPEPLNSPRPLQLRCHCGQLLSPCGGCRDYRCLNCDPYRSDDCLFAL